MKSGVETIMHKGSGLIEKAKEELGGHSEAASHSKELGKLHSFRVSLKGENGLQLATFFESCIQFMWSLSELFQGKDALCVHLG